MITNILLSICLFMNIVQWIRIGKLKKHIDNLPGNINVDIPDSDPFGENADDGKDREKINNNRRGIIKSGISETLEDKTKKHHTVIIEVEEVEQLGTRSRIKILKATGSSSKDVLNYAIKNTAEIVLSTEIEFFP